MDIEDEQYLRLIHQAENDSVTIEYNEQTDTFDILDSEGKKIDALEKTVFDEIVQPSVDSKQIVDNTTQAEQIQLVNDSRNRAYYYLQRLKEMDAQQREQESKIAGNLMFDLGDDLNGNNLSYRDLQLALMTGKDLDGIDIPGDTPEERNAEESIQEKEEKVKGDIDEYEIKR